MYTVPLSYCPVGTCNPCNVNTYFIHLRIVATVNTFTADNEF